MIDKQRLQELAGIQLHEAEKRIPGRQLSDVKWKNRPKATTKSIAQSVAKDIIRFAQNMKKDKDWNDLVNEVQKEVNGLVSAALIEYNQKRLTSGATKRLNKEI